MRSLSRWIRWAIAFHQEVFNIFREEEMTLSKEELMAIAAKLGAESSGSKGAIESAIRSKLGEPVAEGGQGYSFGQVLRNNGRVLAEELLPVALRRRIGIGE
jgi:hypothetical protein